MNPLVREFEKRKPKEKKQFYYLYNGEKFLIPETNKLDAAIRNGKQPTNRPIKDDCFGYYDYITTKSDKQ